MVEKKTPPRLLDTEPDLETRKVMALEKIAKMLEKIEYVIRIDNSGPYGA